MAVRKATQRRKLERRTVMAYAKDGRGCRHAGNGVTSGICGDSWRNVRFTRVVGTKRWKRGKATCYVGGHPQDKRGSELNMTRTELMAKLNGGA